MFYVLLCIRRLDAIGAIGIARCFSFGGRFQRSLYNPDIPPRNKLTKADYMDAAYEPTSINHFHEKLLKLQVLACPTGKKCNELLCFVKSTACIQSTGNS